MSKKKISQFDLTTTLNDSDLITLVQEEENRNITASGLKTNLTDTFATNEQLEAVQEDVDALEETVASNYEDLSTKIEEGDEEVSTLLSSTMTEYYEVLSDDISELEEKHDDDISSLSNTIESWIDTIDDKSTTAELEEALNRLTVAENAITSLADVIANGNISGDTVGYHTQPTSTITSLSGYYKGTSADALVTTDTLNEALSKLENQIDDLADSSGSLPVISTGESTTPTDSNIYTAAKVKEDYLFKTGDTATGVINFQTGLRGLTSGQSFVSGWNGTGASLYPSSSKWNLEVDNLLVRGSMTVNELVVNEIRATNGDILVTLASMTCTEVEESDTGYICYFDDDDGNIYNEFLVNDQVICQKFNGSDVRRYWRSVIEVGDDYITLSKDICESGSAVPAADDDIILLGHRVEGDEEYDETMDDRRNAIWISTQGDNAPSITFYAGIDDFTLEDKETTVIGKSSKFVGSFTVVSDSGDTSSIPVYRGTWNATTTYYYYDYVTYDGSLWLCTYECTGEEPSEDSSYWTLYISKGDSGAASDDVARWVAITGEYVFKYDTSDYSDTPTPTNIALTATTYGMTDPTFVWTNYTEDSSTLGTSRVFNVTPDMISDTSAVFKCLVTDGDTGGEYYDLCQIVKLCSGEDGESVYTAVLSNYSASVPFDSDGNILVDPTTIQTTVTVYYGTEIVDIDSITGTFAEGTGGISVVEDDLSYTIYLTELTSTQARINLSIVADGGLAAISKDWYINMSEWGADGEGGEEGATVYMSGELVFHYSEYSDVPDPTEITLYMYVSASIATYEWYWAISGTSDYTLLEGENEDELVVYYNGTYFTSTGVDEITFMCIATTESGVAYTDLQTINNVYDGDSAFHVTATNQQMTVTAAEDGSVSDWSEASCYLELWCGGEKLEAEDWSMSITSGTGNGTLYTDEASSTYQKKVYVSSSSGVDDKYLTVSWQVSCVYDSTVVDVITIYLVKNTVGATGSSGTNVETIWCKSNETPTRPTFTSRISSSGSTSGSYVWYPDAISSTSYLIWNSVGYYDANNGCFVEYTDDDGSGLGYYWSTPVCVSAVDGEDGVGIASVTMYYYKSTSQTTTTGGSWTTTAPTASSGYWIWTKLLITYDDGNTAWTDAVCTTGATGADGDDGSDGPGLNFRGEWDSSTYYYWTDDDGGNLRDVVYLSDTSKYYAVYSKGLTVPKNYAPDDYTGTYWLALTSFENIATGLLFAESATIAGINFYDNIIQSQSGFWYLDGRATSATKNYPLFAVGYEVCSSGATYIENGTSPTAPILLGTADSYYAVLGVGTNACETGANGLAVATAGVSSTGSDYDSSGSLSSTSIRFWAGSTWGSRGSAPFRVSSSGYLYCSNLYAKGSIYASTAEFSGSVTCSSISSYALPGIICMAINIKSRSVSVMYVAQNLSSPTVSYASTDDDTAEDAGYIVITHNIGHTNYRILMVGNTNLTSSQTSNTGFLGALSIMYRTATSTRIYCKDTDNSAHAPGVTSTTGVDLFFLDFSSTNY